MSVDYWVVCDHCHVKAWIGKSIRTVGHGVDDEMMNRLAAILFVHTPHTAYGARITTTDQIPLHYVEDKWEEEEPDPNKLEWEANFNPLIRHELRGGEYTEHRRHGALGSPSCNVCSNAAWIQYQKSLSMPEI